MSIASFPSVFYNELMLLLPLCLNPSAERNFDNGLSISNLGFSSLECFELAESDRNLSSNAMLCFGMDITSAIVASKLNSLLWMFDAVSFDDLGWVNDENLEDILCLKLDGLDVEYGLGDDCVA